MSADGEGSRNVTYSMPGTASYVMEPDEESVEEIRKAIKEMYE